MYKKMSLPAVFGDSLLLFFVMVLPADENSCSAGTDVAGTASIRRAITLRFGNWWWCSFHQTSGGVEKLPGIAIYLANSSVSGSSLPNVDHCSCSMLANDERRGFSVTGGCTCNASNFCLNTEIALNVATVSMISIKNKDSHSCWRSCSILSLKRGSRKVYGAYIMKLTRSPHPVMSSCFTFSATVCAHFVLFSTEIREVINGMTSEIVGSFWEDNWIVASLNGSEILSTYVSLWIWLICVRAKYSYELLYEFPINFS